ncbi:radical SAM/SPASM domain-containing protein [candidate division KSB1 bacterium]
MRYVKTNQSINKQIGSFVSNSPTRIYGWKKDMIDIIIRLHIFWIALTIYRNPFTAGKVLKRLMEKRRLVKGNIPVQKYVKANNRYFWSAAVPGWPSLPFISFIKNELNRLHPYRLDNGHLLTMIFSITNKCHLQCEHCFEWDNLDIKEKLSFDDLKEILKKFQARGIDQIQLSGGEPLRRLNDAVELIKTAGPNTEFWLLTSGYGLTPERASRLKAAGLTGVNISLDHWDEKPHNEFRNNDKSFYWAKEAALNSRKVDMAVCFSLCPVKDFISVENLWKYADLTKRLGAGFIRILEPKNAGRFNGKDVELNEVHKKTLREFDLTMNSDPLYRDMPIVMFPGVHQDTIGCFGAGNRYLYVDSNGDLHACPFCQNKVGNVLKDSLEESIQKMREIGCHNFKSNLSE